MRLNLYLFGTNENEDGHEGLLVLQTETKCVSLLHCHTEKQN